MDKTTSCGVVILNEDGEILLCHATENAHWDLPKGNCESGERRVSAALRELFEETGLRLTEDRLVELGIFEYRPAKDLHLYAARMTRSEAAIERCVCTSMFPSPRDGRMIPEMDDFRWTTPSSIQDYCSGSLYRLFATRLSLFELHERLG
ncbi:NUDIX hydrolase [Paraburkholderia sp. UCT31]|uniref:NUDIX hydrolase n=1 Tax=Paraburkholderia sp. UCT31 TaxID=2615209 RepID=UPI0016557F8F|nr:NUDIX hydrolase [Paraburkholderia sp. UCT31]MBC8737370.1 NUDIX hydrolase [Paraburkholderia sp. UCT31]